MIGILLALCSVVGAFAHPPPLCANDPICPSVPTVANFDKNQYRGTWYEQAQIETTRPMDLKCVRIAYTRDPKNDTIRMVFSATDKRTGDRIMTEAISIVSADQTEASKLSMMAEAISIVPADQTKGSKLSMELRRLPTTVMLNRWVLATDYDTYSFVYSCNLDNGEKTVWLMTREPEPNEYVLKELMNKARELDIDVSLFQITDQTGCDYYS